MLILDGSRGEGEHLENLKFYSVHFPKIFSFELFLYSLTVCVGQ